MYEMDQVTMMSPVGLWTFDCGHAGFMDPEVTIFKFRSEEVGSTFEPEDTVQNETGWASKTSVNHWRLKL